MLAAQSQSPRKRNDPIRNDPKGDSMTGRCERRLWQADRHETIENRGAENDRVAVGRAGRWTPQGIWMLAGILCLVITTPATAQITAPRTLSTVPDRTANLEEQLINRLRAVAPDQQAFVRHIVQLTEQDRLDLKLVVAVERYALKRNSVLPFPYFERAIRYLAEKRGLTIPAVRQFATTAAPTP
ncbi:hypothetical protein Mal65_03620 [Crateriforma conspicua]|nr:hypothetical protein Mal65_03620 [Crateriforma conspicua]